MKKLTLLIFFLYNQAAYTQTNCSLYSDSAHRKACEIFQKAILQNQGSKKSQFLFLRSLQSCPTFGPSLHEMSVPYLKRGDFYTWKLLMDRAVAEDPAAWLGDRGWCYFKFLKDYENSFADLQRLSILKKGQPGYTGDGDYDLRIIMALCLRESGKYRNSMEVFNICIADHEKHKNIGLYDYLHRGITKLKMKDYNGAVADLIKESTVYYKLADTYYYLAKTYLKLNKTKKARHYLRFAYELYTKTGYHQTDSYCEEPDEIYLADIVKLMRTKLLRYGVK